jgi:hypothetical protein
MEYPLNAGEHKDHKAFLEGLRDLQRVTLEFRSKEDGNITLTRSCAPMDYGPKRNAKDKTNRYHLWDYDSDKRPHTISLLPEQVISITLTNHQFSPSEFVTWSMVNLPWFISRDWGEYS